MSSNINRAKRFIPYYSYDNQELMTKVYVDLLRLYFLMMLQNLVEAIATKGTTVKPP